MLKQKIATACIAASLSLSAAAFEFGTVTPENAGYDGKQLAEIQAKFDELYQDGKIPNYAIGVYTPDNLFYSAKMDLRIYMERNRSP
jgi:hypothetical protein